MMILISVSFNSTAWSNGGYSDDINNPDYGTHDWIAEKALAMLPVNESQYIRDNFNQYLYGTELPDNPVGLFNDGIADTSNHHVYFEISGTVTDNASADRAEAMYDDAMAYILVHDYKNASKCAGEMTHYISDLAVFGHVMGYFTAWGEESHHLDYETYVLDHQADFKSYIVFDGILSEISAYDATIELAHDTAFDDGGTGRDCLWMDQNMPELDHSWTDSDFEDRAGRSMNLAVNLVADVLHTLAIESGYTGSETPSVDDTDTDPVNDDTEAEETPADEIPGFELWTMLLAMMIAIGIVRFKNRDKR